MNERIAVIVAVFVVGVASLATIPVGGRPTGDHGDFGADISAFMQSSVADVSSSVDEGMWMAEFQRADSPQREQLVRQRTTALESRVERLETRRRELLNQTDGDITVRDRAKAARLAARIENLEQAIDHTRQTASVAGIDSAKLEQLRSRASNLDGDRVAGVARGLRQKSASISAAEAADGAAENRGGNSSKAENQTRREGSPGSKGG